MTQIKFLYTFLFCNFFILLFCIDGEILSPEMGTIIVTYQSDEMGQRLDRIHFWLINGKQERTLYPKKDEFLVHSHTKNEKTVVITHLLPDDYHIEFLLPNKDHFFDSVPIKEVSLTAGEVVKVDQTIRLRSPAAKEEDTKEIAYGVIHNPYFFYPPPPPTPTFDPLLVEPIPRSLPVRLSTLSLTTNKPVTWHLMHQGEVIHTGVGSHTHVLIPAKQGYYILAENVPGYTFFTAPAPPFNVEIGQNLHIDLFFQRDVGSLTIEGVLPANVPYLTITIYEEKVPEPIVKENLTAINGKIQWESTVLPSDNYIILYNLPGQTIPVHSQNFIIKKNSVLNLTIPTTISQTLKTSQPNANTLHATEKASVRVTTDTSQGIFVLTTEDGAVVEKGSGYQYTFYQVPPGSYLISFSSTNPTLIPPSSKKIVLRGKQELDVTAHYTRATPTQFQNIPQPTPAPTSSAPPTNIVESKSSRAGLDIMSNLTDGRIVLEKLSEPKTQKNYYLHGKTIFIPLDTEGEFRIIFTSVPNYDTPDPIVINRKKNDLTYIGVSYTLNENLLEVPAGIAIVGDSFNENKQNETESKEINLPAFRIGAYQVTNTQFADWLTQSFESKKIKWNDMQPGYIWTIDGLLICRTFEATSSAQLTVQGNGTKKIVTPLIGKEHHPVIEVSWYGAQAYCKDKGYRLPTEAEWVKAAGMSLPSKSEKAKRFKYGFGQDVVDRTWANYRDGSRPIDSIQVLTTPVGYYNGKNSLPLSLEDATVAYTHDAKSPIGAYDMSGNVWEWVANETQTGSQIVKGGCYDSLAEGIRVSERLLLPPHHTDIYTGFRVAQ